MDSQLVGNSNQVKFGSSFEKKDEDLKADETMFLNFLDTNNRKKIDTSTIFNEYQFTESTNLEDTFSSMLELIEELSEYNGMQAGMQAGMQNGIQAGLQNRLQEEQSKASSIKNKNQPAQLANRMFFQNQFQFKSYEGYVAQFTNNIFQIAAAIGQGAVLDPFQQANFYNSVTLLNMHLANVAKGYGFNVGATARSLQNLQLAVQNTMMGNLFGNDANRNGMFDLNDVMRIAFG